MAQSSFQGFLSPRPDRKGGGGNVKSMQSGIANFTTETSLSPTLASVNPNNSIVLLNAFATTASNANNFLTRGFVQNQTTTSIIRGGSTNIGLSVAWQVIEYFNVKSVQKGSLSLNTASSSTTAALNTINLAKSIVVASCDSNWTTDTSISAAYFQYYISDANTITFKHITSFGNKNVEWQVVEFY